MSHVFAVVAETKDGSVRKIAFEMLTEARRLAAAAAGAPSPPSQSARSHGRGRPPRAAGRRPRRARGRPVARRVRPGAFAEGLKKAVESLKPDALFIGGTAQGRTWRPASPRACAPASRRTASASSGRTARFTPDARSSPARRSRRWGGMPPAPWSPPCGPTRFSPASPMRRERRPWRRSRWATSPSAPAPWLRESEGEELDLTEANVIVAGGRAMNGAENFEMLKKLCKTIGGTLGASRAAVDAGWIDHHYQVGQTERS